MVDGVHHSIDGDRHVAQERLWTNSAAAMVDGDATALIMLAEQRAGDGVVRDIDHRNFIREVLEELADARNYLVWLAEQIRRRQLPSTALSDELHEAIALSLACTSEAFAHADRARTLMLEWNAGGR